MDQATETAYRYIKLGRHYLSTDQSLFSAIKLFVIAHRRLKLRSLHVYRKQALFMIVALIAWRLRLKDYDSIELPVFGHLCRRVHGGHKVFNLAEPSVIKIFTPSTPHQRISAEITGALAKNALSFAPAVLDHNLAQRWYTEVYICGNPGREYYGANLQAFLDRFDRDIARCIAQILTLRPPRRYRLDRYLLKTVNRVTRRASRPGIREDAQLVILRFVDNIRESLEAAHDRELWLAFSHGDFSMTNVLRTRDRIVVIDWESAARRSLLFDFYSYFFGEVYYGRLQPAAMGAVVSRAIHSLDVHLRGKMPEQLKLDTMAASVYRRLFYLERLKMLSERKSTDEKFVDVALRYIKAFASFETALSGPAHECASDLRYSRILADVRRAEHQIASPSSRPDSRPQWPALAMLILRRGWPVI